TNTFVDGATAFITTGAQSTGPGLGTVSSGDLPNGTFYSGNHINWSESATATSAATASGGADGGGIAGDPSVSAGAQTSGPNGNFATAHVQFSYHLEVTPLFPPSWGLKP